MLRRCASHAFLGTASRWPSACCTCARRHLSRLKPWHSSRPPHQAGVVVAGPHGANGPASSSAGHAHALSAQRDLPWRHLPTAACISSGKAIPYGMECSQNGAQKRPGHAKRAMNASSSAAAIWPLLRLARPLRPHCQFFGEGVSSFAKHIYLAVSGASELSRNTSIQLYFNSKYRQSIF